MLTVFEPFVPHILFPEGHSQTLAGFLSGRLPGIAPSRPGLRTERVVLPCEDGTGDSLLFFIERSYRNPKAPAVVLVHGLEGDANSPYVLILARKLLDAGFHVLRFNMRTCGDGIHLARNAYNAALTLDVETILKYARKNLSSRLALVGFSLGANVVLKYMGEDQSERNRQRIFLKAAAVRGRVKERLAQVFAAISPPLELRSSCHKIDSSALKVYRMNFVKEMKRSLLEKDLHMPFDPERELPEIRTLFDLDHSFTAPMAGFKTALEYYAAASSHQFVPAIEEPGLILHAQDDPMISMEGWEKINWKSRKKIRAVLTEKGGHLGWVSRKHPLFADRRWMDYLVLNYLLDWRDA